MKYKTFLRKHPGHILGVSLLGIFSSLAMVYAGYSLSFFYTTYECTGDKTEALFHAFLIELGIWLAAMGVCYATSLAEAKIQQKLKNELRSMVSSKIASLDYIRFTGRDSGHYVSWLTNDVDQIYDQSLSPLFAGIENLATAVFALGALCLLSPFIGLAAAALLAVISVLPQLTAKRLREANRDRSAAMETGVESYKDVVMGSPIFFLADLRNCICERIAAASEKAELADYRFNCTNTTAQSLISTVSMVGQCILLSVTLFVAIAGVTPAGAVLSVGNLAGSFFNGAGAFVRSFMTVKASGPLWEKFGMDTAYPDTAKSDLDEIPEITLHNVSFRYGDRVILQDKNYAFRAGCKYAIMGESGSGKTTLAKIILGLLPGYTGEIRYGQVEQRHICLESLHRHMAYVDQQVYLFQDTIRFNITLGQSFTDREIMAVIRECRLEDFVNSLPDGLDTLIGENGKNLSGGQRQRIALARGLIRNVQYIVLDEGTSALDEANASDIENSLLNTPWLGVIIITHHLRDSIRGQLTAVYQL